MQIKPIASNMTELTFTPKETTAYGDQNVVLYFCNTYINDSALYIDQLHRYTIKKTTVAPLYDISDPLS